MRMSKDVDQHPLILLAVMNYNDENDNNDDDDDGDDDDDDEYHNFVVIKSVLEVFISLCYFSMIIVAAVI